MAQMPSIHLNGSSAERLLEEYLNAAEAIRNAQAALAKTAPNARDYYPQGAGAFDKADDEHTARLQRMQDTLNEIEALALHVADRRDERAGA